MIVVKLALILFFLSCSEYWRGLGACLLREVLCWYSKLWHHCNSVYWLGYVTLESGLISQHEQGAFSSVQAIVRWVPGYLSVRVKYPWCEADLWHSSSEVKKAWSYTSTFPHALMAWCSAHLSSGTTSQIHYTRNITPFDDISRLQCYGFWYRAVV